MSKTKIIKNFFLTSSVILIAAFLLFGQNRFLIARAADTEAETDASVLELNKKIAENQQKIKEMDEQINAYQQKITQYQSEASSLKNQVAVLDNRLAKTALDIKATAAQIEDANLKIEKISLQIKESEDKINQQKDILAANLKVINQLDQKDYLEVFILNNSFSEFFNQLQYLSQVQNGVHESLKKVQELKQTLERQDSDLQQKKQQLTDLQTTMEDQQTNLDSQRVFKGYLLTQTRSSERNFQNLLTQLQQEQQAVENEISGLEKEMRKKLAGETDKSLPGVVNLSWPVDPSRGISAYFHDPDYPFRYIFEHPAIDIRASQGTPIKAAESGYVARAKDAGFGYSYIMLIHGNNLSTVYGHVSKISVQEDQYIVKGQVIGLTGGMPGTPGAGNLSTGPHLHFEVRYRGIPVNPLEYLP